MKKPKIYPLLLTALSLCAFLLGFYWGRNTARPEITLATTPAKVYTYTVPDSSELVNINTASKFELMSLPGIGETLALRIIAYREENGPFVSVEALLNVQGVGKKILNNMLDKITTGG